MLTRRLGQRDAQRVLRGPFIGSEAIAAGKVRKHELRSRYNAVFPRVYFPRDVTPDFRERVRAANLWAGRNAVFAGLTAARLYGTKWLGDDLPIEMLRHAKPPNGIRCYSVQLSPGEVCTASGLRITTPVRTAFDIGRRGELDSAIAHLDTLGAATGLRADTVREFARLHRGARGIRQLKTALEFTDPGAESPKETWLRLLLVRAGFPKPRTQVRVGKYRVDMGWEDLKLAAEYDGEQHRTDPLQFAKDIERLEELADLGWGVLRASKRSQPDEIVRRFRRMWDKRVS